MWRILAMAPPMSGCGQSAAVYPATPTGAIVSCTAPTRHGWDLFRHPRPALLRGCLNECGHDGRDIRGNTRKRSRRHVVIPRIGVAALSALCALLVTAQAQTPSEFYRGKQIKFVVGT